MCKDALPINVIRRIVVEMLCSFGGGLGMDAGFKSVIRLMIYEDDI